jgi:rubrerythrin
MPRVKGALNRPKTDDELIAILKARGFNVSKAEKTEDPPADPPAAPAAAAPAAVKEIPRDSLKIKAPPLKAKIFNTCGLCGGRFEDKPARCPHCGATFSGWRDDN